MAYTGLIGRLIHLKDSMSPGLKIFLGIWFVGMSILSVYARINTKFGAKIFTKVPENELRTNMWHITEYTIIPIIVTIFYLVLVLT